MNSTQTVRIVSLVLLALFAATNAMASSSEDTQSKRGATLVKKAKPGEAQGFNPQPEPPGDVAKLKSSGQVNPGEAQGFIPQPEPPGNGLSSKSSQQQ